MTNSIKVLISKVEFACLGDAKNFDHDRSSNFLRNAIKLILKYSTKMPEFELNLLAYIQESQSCLQWGVDKTSSQFAELDNKTVLDLEKHLNVMIDLHNYYLHFITSTLCDKRLEEIPFPSAEFPVVSLDWNSPKTFETLRGFETIYRLPYFKGENLKSIEPEDLRNFFLSYIRETARTDEAIVSIGYSVRRILNSKSFSIRQVMMIIIDHNLKEFSFRAKLKEQPFIAAYISEEDFKRASRNRVNRLISNYRRSELSPTVKKLKVEDVTVTKIRGREELKAAQDKLAAVMKDALQLLHSQKLT